MTTPTTHDVFLSYNSQDGALALQLAELLRQRRLRLLSGSRWRTEGPGHGGRPAKRAILSRYSAPGINCCAAYGAGEPRRYGVRKCHGITVSAC
jgi:hypothetical protein